MYNKPVFIYSEITGKFSQFIIPMAIIPNKDFMYVVPNFKHWRYTIKSQCPPMVKSTDKMFCRVIYK